MSELPKYPYPIILNAGVQVNNGFMEDSEPFDILSDTKAEVIGPLKNGALPIRFLEGPLCDNFTVFQYHQPEPR